MAEIYTAAVEMGQGLYTLLTQIVRTELGVDRGHLPPRPTRWPGTPASTSASRQSMMAGGAVQLACAQVRAALRERAGAVEPAGPAGDAAATGSDGHVTSIPPVPSRRGSGRLLAEPIERSVVYHHRPTQAFDSSGQGDIHVSFAFAAERAVVEVDEELGLVRVVQVTAAVDAGRVLNPAGFEGQVEGGTAQGLGFALMEEIQVQQGIIRNPSFTDYLIPTILDVPPVVSVAVEVPEPGVPYGLKGIGESPTVVATAAIVAALRDATGRELNRAPVTPDELAGPRAGPAARCRDRPVPEVPGQWPVAYYYSGPGQSAG